MISALFALPIPELRVLIVDDNSPDGTGCLADQFAADLGGRLGVLHRESKLGLGTAYVSGFRRAISEGAQAIGQMDADFSHPPEMLVTLFKSLDECECDVALGSRYVAGGSVDQRWPLWRKSLSAFGNFYARTILRLPVCDVTGGFRVWRRSALLQMPLERLRSNGYAFQVEITYVAHLLGLRMKEYPFYFADRRWGHSKMSLRIQREAAVRVWQMLYEYRNLKRHG